MAVNTQKFLPGSSSSAIVKVSKKTSAISNPISAIVKADAIESKKEKDPLLSIYKKVIKVDKFLKNNLLLQSKEEEKVRAEKETVKKQKKEKELESPKNKFKGFETLKNALPKTGILDSIKRFILFTFAGWVFTKLFKFLPVLSKFIKVIGQVYSWVEGGIGMLLEGLVSFIDFGYKAYDKVRAFTKLIGGENLQNIFDSFSSNLNKFLNLAIVAAMIAARSGGFGGGKGAPRGPSRFTKPQGKPKVTTSGGRPAGKPGIKNPFRKKPTVTTSGGRTGGKFQFPKGAGALTKGARGIIGIGTILDIGIRIASGQPVSKAIVGAAGGAIGAGIGTWLGGAIGGVAGSVVPIIGNLLLGSAGATIGGILGGMIGGGIADALYDAVTGYGKDKEIQKKSSGGVVKGKAKRLSSGSRVKRSIKVRRSFTKIKSDRIQPGKDIGGKRKIQKLYPDPESSFFGFKSGEFNWMNLFFGSGNNKRKRNRNKLPNSLKALVNTAESLGSSGDWIGALMQAGVQVALGQIPDIKGLSKGISQVMDSARLSASQGIVMMRKSILGFSDGGLVSMKSFSTDNTSSMLERALEGTIQKRVNDALNSIKKETRKRGPTGRDEMLEENRQRDVGPGAPGAPGAPGEPGEGQTAVTGNEYERAVLDLLATAEGTTKSYGTVFGGRVNKDLESGKLTVKEVIDLGNNATTGSGATGRYQFMPSTLQGLIKNGVLKPNDKFTPEMQDKAALALIRGRGVDPSKPLKESDIYRLGGEWASLEGGPGMKKGGSYSYNGRSQVKYDAKKALEIYDKALKTQTERRSQTEAVSAVSQGFRTGLKTGPAGRIGAGTEYHVDARMIPNLPLKDKIAMIDSMALAHAQEGYVMEFSGIGVAGSRWDPSMSQKDKEKFAERVLTSHHAAREGWQPFDYYIVKQSAKNRFDKSAEGSNIMAPRIPGGTYEYGEDEGRGRHLTIRDKNGRVIFQVMHGDRGVPSPKQIGKAFKMDDLAEKSKSQTAKREYDVIIPLDHHKGKLPPKSLWPNASMGASGREREAQDPTAEIMKARLEAKGLRVKIMKPDDYRTEDDYNKDLVKYSQSGSVVSSIHYDAPSNVRNGGIGFLARLGNSPDKNDREYASKLAPILEAMAREAGGPGQRYGGIDTEGNITMRLSGPATAALIELGALVEQEKKYGKEFWKNPEFVKHLNDVADATASSVKSDKQGTTQPSRAKGQTAILGGKSVTWDGTKWIPSDSREAQNIQSSMRQKGQTATLSGKSVTWDGTKWIPSDSSKAKKLQISKKEKDNEAKLISQRPWWDKLGWFGGASAHKNTPTKKQGGGSISPIKYNRPNLAAHASYENTGKGSLIVLPIEIEKQSSMFGGNSMYNNFPVA